MDNATNPNTTSEQNTTKENSENEQKNNTTALEAKIKELEAERDKLKQSVTNASADASKWKKQYQDKLSDEEKAKEQQSEANAALQKELDDLRNERNIAKYTAALSASDIGMDAETATAVAQALNAGETEKVFDGIRSFIVSHDKALAEKALLNNPKLHGGASTKTVTLEEFKNMGYREMVAFKSEHPDLYAEYTRKT